MKVWRREWWKRNICDEFPHDPWCFDCDAQSCEECVGKEAYLAREESEHDRLQRHTQRQV